ncbi:MAG: hypothetical protein QOE90_3340 [Thermoplasmata archaeon]|jgi:hypothetical protein|nr:hypothetical protein [Thermoplasmata archaeon]
MPSPATKHSFADARIAEKIAPLPHKPREGLARVNAEMRAAGVAPTTRLHLLSAVLDLGRLADSTRPDRVARASPIARREVAWPHEPDFLD